MRLVLLPGLNGSSHLFRPLLDELDGIPIEVLELPAEGPQDHDSLAATLHRQLGEEPFVLLGESFSGAIAYRIALQQPPGLRGVIFAASFLSRPSALLPLIQHLPIPRRLSTLSAALKIFCVGRDASDELLQQLKQEIRLIPDALLRARLQSLAELRAPQQRLALPALHLWPQQDRLVSHQVASQLAGPCSDLQQVRIEGPHFILQTQAAVCAHAIRGFMAELQDGEQALGQR
ncbi:alpha/beta fold hydrolase [Pseudomonas sp.]|uniref:alpha/beta fold hydrolase n=1 Tax=Pseudomonas sp. TaxID=306 RepID=UPI003D0CBCCF